VQLMYRLTTETWVVVAGLKKSHGSDVDLRIRILC
jgi:hypothetical protein